MSGSLKERSKERLTVIYRELPCVSRIMTPLIPCVETGSQDLLEELLSNLVHLIVEVPLL